MKTRDNLITFYIDNKELDHLKSYKNSAIKQAITVLYCKFYGSPDLQTAIDRAIEDLKKRDEIVKSGGMIDAFYKQNDINIMSKSLKYLMYYRQRLTAGVKI